MKVKKAWLQRLLSNRLCDSYDVLHHDLSKKVSEGHQASCIKAINLHTTLVQEFFPLRVQAAY